MHTGHRERLRERYISEDGLDSFQSHEVLELLLTYAIPRQDVNPLAHRLLEHFGSLSSVLEANVEDLTAIDGMGKNAAVLLGMMPALLRAYSKDKWRERPRLINQKVAGSFAVSLFAGRYYECFILICLDAQKRVIETPVIVEGTIDETPMYPRLVVEAALRHRAQSVIFSHNHPSGSLKPSQEDLETTMHLRTVLSYIGIEALDHIIVGGNRYISLVASRLMEEGAPYEIDDHLDDETQD